MNFKSPNGDAMKTTAMITIGLIVGAMGSRAAIGVIDTPKTGLDAAAEKTQKLMRIGKRTAIAGAGAYAAAGLDGKDDVSIIAKYAGLGAVLMQVVDGVKDAAAANATTAGYATGTNTQKIIAKSLGLGCPCESGAINAMPLNRASRSRRRLNGIANSNAFMTPPIIGYGNPTENHLQKALGAGSKF